MNFDRPRIDVDLEREIFVCSEQLLLAYINSEVFIPSPAGVAGERRFKKTNNDAQTLDSLKNSIQAGNKNEN